MSIRDASVTVFLEALCAKLDDPACRSERRKARSHFSPALAYGRHTGPPIPSAKPAAVLIVLEPGETGWTIPLTVRPRHLPDHPGQISLPGGRLESGETHRQAALREFREEMGTEFEGKVAGSLQPAYVFNSNYYVRPFVGIASAAQNYSPCSYEVERIVQLPVSSLLDTRHHHTATFSRGPIQWSARVISCANDQIWGATAVMLGELSALLKALPMPEICSEA